MDVIEIARENCVNLISIPPFKKYQQEIITVSARAVVYAYQILEYWVRNICDSICLIFGKDIISCVYPCLDT